MPRKFSKCLVIDATVACAAGFTDHPTSKNCREFLQTVWKICHRIVLMVEIEDEYKMYQSSWASTWLTTMTSKSKDVHLNLIPDNNLRHDVEEVATNENQRVEMLKDMHLLEAALATDLNVVSLDETARRHFQTAAQIVTTLKPILWVNPDLEEDEAISWLESGAPPEPERRLGNS